MKANRSKLLFQILLLTFLIVLSLTPLNWFRGRDAIIDGIDTNFPLDPMTWFARRMFVWSDIPNAGTNFASSTAGIVFHFTQLLPFLFNAPLQTVQIISLVFWFTTIIFSAYLFAKSIFASKGVQLIFVVFYSFNIYLFNTWENAKVANLALVASIPLMLALIETLFKKRLPLWKWVFACLGIGLIASGAGINPAYFAVLIGVVFIYSILRILFSKEGEPSTFKIKALLLSIFLVVVVNSFWIFPTGYFIGTNIDPSNSIDKIGFTNWVDSLSQDTSILNIMRGQGAWDWYAIDSISGLPLYIPYAVNYFYNPPFIAFSFLIPALAIVSLILRKKQNTVFYVIFSVLFILGVFLGTGTHLPSGTLYRWLLIHVPFFSLFRSPWYIFTPITSLAIAGLLSLFIARILDGRHKIIASLAILALLTGNFLYSYPIVTGKIFRIDRNDTFFIKFPQYVFDSKKWLSERRPIGRVIGYPDDELENFSWKYRGIESILSLFSEAQTLFSPLNMPDAPTAKLIKQFYLETKKGQLQAARAIAQKLIIELIFLKGDQPSLSPPLPSSVVNLPQTTFGPWRFIEFSEENQKIFSPASIFTASAADGFEKIIGVLKKDEVLVNSKDSMILSLPINPYIGKIIKAKNQMEQEYKEFSESPSILSNRLRSRDAGLVSYFMEISESGQYKPVLEKYLLENFGLSQNSTFSVEINGKAQVWEVEETNDSYVIFKSIDLVSGNYNIVFNLGTNVNRRRDTFDTLNIVKNGQGEFTIREENGDRYLNILNTGLVDVGAEIQIPDFRPYSTYLIQFRYKQIYGNNAQVLVTQSKNDILVKTQVERLPNYPEWNVFSFYYQPVQTDSTASLRLLAPQTKDPLGTKVNYDDLIISQLFTNNLLFIKQPMQKIRTPSVSYKKINPVEYRGTVEKVSGPHLLVFAENYSKDWEISILTPSGKALPATIRHFTGDSYANAWYINAQSEKYLFKISYKSQKYFLIGAVVSVGVLIFGIFLLIFTVRKRNRK